MTTTITTMMIYRYRYDESEVRRGLYICR
uniref:Uncharacterized protein n=1 Tax=Lepeophtheirus salmonis TaxID=72036 RepID=A0A0K2UBG0_LEPSM